MRLSFNAMLSMLQYTLKTLLNEKDVVSYAHIASFQLYNRQNRKRNRNYRRKQMGGCQVLDKEVRDSYKGECFFWV